MVNKKKINKISSTENLRYLSRSQYYGKLLDWEYVDDCMVLKFDVYTATKYYGNNTYIRVYVPTDLEEDLSDRLITGENYFIITAPYRVFMKKSYPYRVDLLLNIFKDV